VADIRAGLVSALPSKLVDELLAAHAEVKRNYFLGGHRLNAVEGGRFSEAALRILEDITTGKSTPLGKQLNSERIITELANTPGGSYPDSIRIHIPRALRLVYDIRNKRDAAHLADGIDPNVQDATLVTTVVDWVLAEFVRLYHSVPADEAQRLVEQLVTRQAPVVQDFDGFLKLLKPSLQVSDHCLVLLYHRGEEGASLTELQDWVRPAMRSNLRRTMGKLVDEKDLAHFDGARYRVTRLGQQEVERRRLIDPDA
jgi:hypothetical protein